MNNIEHICSDESTLEIDVQLECCFKIKDLISMLLEFDMNRKATVYTTDKNSILIIIDTSDEETENEDSN